MSQPDGDLGAWDGMGWVQCAKGQDRNTRQCCVRCVLCGGCGNQGTPLGITVGSGQKPASGTHF